MQLSSTSEKVLRIMLSQPDKDFFINELVRKTGLFPNSVFRSLTTLAKQNILSSYSSGKRKFFHINEGYRNLSELRKIVNTQIGIEETNDQVWVKILNRQSSYSFTAALMESNMENLKKRYGFSISTFWFNNITYGVYYLKNDLMILGRTVSDLIRSDPDFAQSDIKACHEICDHLVKISREIPEKRLVQMSNKELARILKEFYQSYLEVFPFVTVPHGIERFFEDKIRREVTDKDILEILMAPTNTTDEERDDALKIAAYARKKGFESETEKRIEKHRENYCWLSLWSINAKPLSYEYFEDEIKNILERVRDPEKELKRIQNEETKTRKKLRDTLRKINATRELIDEVHHLQEYVYLRIYRKNSICQAHYFLLPLIYETANRLKMSEDDIKLLSIEEMIYGLSGNESLQKLEREVRNRQKGWALLMRDGKTRTTCGVKEIIDTMERYRIIAPTSAMQRSVKGTVASRGKAIGKVKIVTKLSELEKVQKGDVLVAKMTTPDYMIAINKVAAIVTDEGGVTCHAAIVSREFNIPCITSTRNATQILSDNDLVEVDAQNGVVRVIETIETPENIRLINGKTIYKGRVRGSARIVLDAADFEKVKHNDILIAPQTTPEYLSSLYRVKGFVVDEDSITSHAMLYGKALRLPSLMGTNFARHFIKDGDMIELDATRGLVKRL